MTVEELILDYANNKRTIGTWWMSDFYSDFCKVKGCDFNDLYGTARKIRYHCNKLVKKGKLKKRRTGTGWCGGTDFGHNHSTDWYIE